MTELISTAKASARLEQLIRKANRKRARFIVGEPGEPAGVLLGIEDYIRTFGPEPAILRRIGEESKKTGADKITMREIDREIAAYRREKRAASPKGRA